MAHIIKALLTLYEAGYVKRYGVKAPLVPSKDAPLAKRLLSRYTMEQLSHWLDVFFTMRDPFIERSGHTFGVFSACLAKVIAAAKPVKELTPAQPLSDALRARKAEMEAEWSGKP